MYTACRLIGLPYAVPSYTFEFTINRKESEKVVYFRPTPLQRRKPWRVPSAPVLLRNDARDNPVLVHRSSSIKNEGGRFPARWWRALDENDKMAVRHRLADSRTFEASVPYR